MRIKFFKFLLFLLKKRVFFHPTQDEEYGDRYYLPNLAFQLKLASENGKFDAEVNLHKEPPCKIIYVKDGAKMVVLLEEEFKDVGKVRQVIATK